jgi:hypothetical protein
MTKLRLPKNNGWIVVFNDEKGKMHTTRFYYKQQWRAQQKADELMFIEQKEYYIAECSF